MNVESLNSISIDPVVFRSQHELVKKLRSGQIDQAAFILALKPEDPFMLWNDRLYYITPLEYRTLRGGSLAPNSINRNALFEVLISHSEIQDILGIKEIVEEYKTKTESSTCTECTKNKYKSKVVQIFIQKCKTISEAEMIALSKNTVILNAVEQLKKRSDNVFQNIPYKVWPEQDFTMPARLIYVLPRPDASITMESCLDCVKKHINAAHVFYIEFLCGYTSHKQLCIAELQNAAWESIADYPLLAGTITTSIGAFDSTDILLFDQIVNSLMLVDQEYRPIDCAAVVFSCKAILTAATSEVANRSLVAGTISALETVLSDKAIELRSLRLLLDDSSDEGIQDIVKSVLSLI